MPQIIEVNGENIEFPDSMTDDQIAAAIQGLSQPEEVSVTPQSQLPPTIAATPEQLAAKQAGMTQKQVAQALPQRNLATGMPNGAPLPYGVDQNMLDAVNKDVAAQNERNAALAQDPGFLSKVKQANDAGILSNIGSGIMDTLNQFGEGAENLVDKYLPEPLSRVLNYQPGGDLPFDTTAEQRMAARQERMDLANADSAARMAGAPVSSTIGSMIPYLATGMAGERALNAVSGAVSPITRELVAKGLSKVSPSEATRFANIPRIPSEFRTRAGYAVKAPLIGAGEGSVNYNQTAGEGALASMGGAALGMFGPLTKLSRVENVRDANSKAIIKEMHEEGFSLTPGVRTGNRQMQTEEAGMRNSDVLGDYYHQTVTRPNQRKMTEMAGDAIGLNGKGRDTFSANELSDHMQSLKSQYGQLEANTTGTLTSKHMKEAGDILTDLKPTANRNTSPADKSRYQKVKSITDQILAESTPVSRLPGGARTISGSQYQMFRQRVQDEASQAFQNGDRRLGNALNRIKASLDDAIETGMGRTKAAEWKDLNERYAMTNLLLKSGMTPTGAIDPMGITSAVMKGDEAIRTLTGQGNRIQKLQKIAKYNDVLTNVEGGSLTGLGNADYTANRSLAKLPMRYRLPLYARATGAYRLSRIPTWGFGPTTGMQVGRAIGMTEPLDRIATAAQEGANEFRDWWNSPAEEKK